MDLSQTLEATEIPTPERAPYTLWQVGLAFIWPSFLMVVVHRLPAGQVSRPSRLSSKRSPWKKNPEPLIVVGAAVISLVVYSALHR